jgi:LysM repeat protein
LPTVDEPRPEQQLENRTVTTGPRTRGVVASATPWLLASTVVVVLAVLTGLGTAYLVAGMRAAPSPDAAFLPTPTPTASPTPSPEPTPGPTATETPAATEEPTPEPTEEPTPGPSATPFEYVVVRGDSVTRIALRFGVTPESIIELNDLRPPRYVIHPDQVLLIPATPASPAP